MTAKTTHGTRILSILLCLAMLITYLPMSTLTAAAATSTSTPSIVADPGTADTWEAMMGTAADGNRYAGRVWVDKSVYTDGQVAALNSSGTAGSTFNVALEDDEAFQIIFSALGSSMTSTTTTSSSGPMDVVIVLDNSVSMTDVSAGTTRLQKVIEAANVLLANLLTSADIRIGITSYNYSAETVLPFAKYSNGVVLKVDDYADSGVISAYDNSNTLLGKDGGYQSGTNTQSGIDLAMRMLTSASDTEGRAPVAIILTDGAANTSVDQSFYDISKGTIRQRYYDNGVPVGVALSTLLNAAYMKASVEDHYNGTKPMVYGIGVDLEDNDGSIAIINPGADDGFSSKNPNQNIRTAYSHFINTWAKGNTVTITHSSYSFVLDHNYPSGSTVTDADVINNINYVDQYHNVSSSELQDTFKLIYEELSSGVFNPISSSTTVDGATGVDNTPLIYVDNIGAYMEIKEIQSVTLFGTSYGVTNNADGTYTVQTGTGNNPTTNEAYNTTEDILISVTENEDGTQKLQIKINQEVLPIILEQVSDKIVNGVSSATINELTYDPLRVYYTVGLASDILLPTGEIDVSKIDSDYAYINNETGEITFYSNAFGVMNTADTDSNDLVDMGDAHVGFKPSAKNRYYYHQANQGIFTAVTAKNGAAINWEADEYGVLYEEDKYSFTRLTYSDYSALEDDQRVYTYVSYYRPTSNTTDAATAAEEVTYIVYTDWAYLKESVAFYDAGADIYVNYDPANGYVTGDEGYAIPVDHVDAVIAAYLQANPNAELYAMLGVGSLRTSRLHNMTVKKATNDTETADDRYAPEYTYETASVHNDNDVVVWLGNNGKLTATIDTGIALTKAVTEAIGNANDTYALSVKIPDGVSAVPVVKDANGNDVTTAISTYLNNILTVNVKAGQTVYISGIPSGTECEIGENIPSAADYTMVSKTDTVTVPTLSQVLDGAAQYAPATVTNAPIKYGDLFITKELSGTHAIPDSIMQQSFDIIVNVGTALAGKTYTVKDSAAADSYDATVDANGNIALTIQARQTVEILDLPAGTTATVTEALTSEQDGIFDVSYRTLNHSGEASDTDNEVTIPTGAHATAVITNQYTPNAVTVDLDISGTKIFGTESDASLLPGGSFSFKVQSWNSTTSKWEDIPGKTATTEYSQGEYGTKPFYIDLGSITYYEAGTWTYQVLEVKGSVENVTYDRTLYAFTVTVTDNGGQLVAAVTDLNNDPINDGTYEVTFVNTYHTAPMSIDITKDVDNVSGDPDISNAGFEFTAVQTDENWNVLSGGATFTAYSDGAGKARIKATYTSAGDYYYVVTETDKAAPGWSYSNAEYRVKVAVTSDNGNLTSVMTITPVSGTTAEGERASVDGNSGTISFKNTYDPEDITVDLDTAVRKELANKTLSAGDFVFKVYDDNTTNERLSGTNLADGSVDFDGVLSFSKAGKYEFDIVEINTAIPGVTYDSTIYDLVVEVTNDTQTGKLVAACYFEDATTNTVTFKNVYTVTPTKYALGGRKILNGRAMMAGEFTFELYEGETLLETVVNKADGTFSFTAIDYSQTGTHTYTIKEVEPADANKAPGVTYTGVSTPVTVTVTVSDIDSVLSASADIANANIIIENDYAAAPATVTFKGTKELVGGTLTDNTFTFNLYETDHTFNTEGLTPVTARNVDGGFSFPVRSFNTTGTYFYAIVEDAAVDPLTGIVYDGTQYNFRVQVRDIGDGQLKAVVLDLHTGASTALAAHTTTEVAFTNATFDEVTQKEVYLANDTTTHIDGSKVNAGDILTYFITYTNYTGKAVVVDIFDTIPNHTSYVEGSASHNGSYAGTHVNWVLNVARGESVTVSFNVTVDETDVIFANTAVVRDGVNTYTTNEVVNHTVEDIAVKDVFSSADPTASIDGKDVSSGDELLYTIRYTNTSDSKVDIQITDQIPAHTAYVDGSADNGGIYADGTITWNISDVDAWSTVTVSFKVKVDSGVDGVTITNKAAIQEGNNSYTTNAVTNQVPATPTTPTTPSESESPKTGNYLDLALWFTLMFVSGGAVVTLAVCSRKKETEEI